MAGEGPEKDINMAIEYFEKAANKGEYTAFSAFWRIIVPEITTIVPAIVWWSDKSMILYWKLNFPRLRQIMISPLNIRQLWYM